MAWNRNQIRQLYWHGEEANDWPKKTLSPPQTTSKFASEFGTGLCRIRKDNWDIWTLIFVDEMTRR